MKIIYDFRKSKELYIIYKVLLYLYTFFINSDIITKRLNIDKKIANNKNKKEVIL